MPTRQHGFTLIELIAVIALMGVMGVAMTSGMAMFVNGFLSANATSSSVGKGQIAIMRISKEITQNGVAFIGANGITVRNTGTIQLNNTTVDVNGDPLADNVQAFDLTYFNAAGAQVPVTTPVGMVATVQINLILAEPGTGVQTFSTRVALPSR